MRKVIISLLFITLIIIDLYISFKLLNIKSDFMMYLSITILLLTILLIFLFTIKNKK